MYLYCQMWTAPVPHLPGQPSTSITEQVAKTSQWLSAISDSPPSAGACHDVAFLLLTLGALLVAPSVLLAGRFMLVGCIFEWHFPRPLS